MTQPCSVLVVGQINTTGRLIASLGTSRGAGPGCIFPQTGNAAANAGTSLNTAATTCTSKRAMLATFNGASSFIAADNWLTAGTSAPRARLTAPSWRAPTWRVTSGATGKIAEMIVQSSAPTAAEKAALAAHPRPLRDHRHMRRLLALAVALSACALLRGSRPRCGPVRLAPADERVIHGDSHFSAESAPPRANSRRMGRVHAMAVGSPCWGPHRHDVRGSAASAALSRVGEPGDRQHGRPHRRREPIWWCRTRARTCRPARCTRWVTCSASSTCRTPGTS